MSAHERCRHVARLLERMDAGEALERDAELVAAHLEACPACGVSSDAARPIVEGVRGLGADLPDDAFFAASAEEILSAVRAEPRSARAPSGVALDLAERRARASRAASGATGLRRTRVVGTIAALAAGVALVASVTVLRDRGESVPRVASVESPAAIGPVEVVSVDDIDVDELLESEDAWIIASYDIFDAAVAAPSRGWKVEDLSDDELDALEGVFGAAPSRG